MYYLRKTRSHAIELSKDCPEIREIILLIKVKSKVLRIQQVIYNRII